jgi:hypothetical protein
MDRLDRERDAPLFDARDVEDLLDELKEMPSGAEYLLDAV